MASLTQDIFPTIYQGCIKFPATWYSYTSIFLNLDFLPNNFRPLPTFSTWYSSQQYYRNGDIASPYPFIHVMYFPTALPFLIIWYSSPADLIRSFIHTCQLTYYPCTHRKMVIIYCKVNFLRECCFQKCILFIAKLIFFFISTSENVVFRNAFFSIKCRNRYRSRTFICWTSHNWEKIPRLYRKIEIKI